MNRRKRPLTPPLLYPMKVDPMKIRYAKISRQIWNDAKFANMSDDAQLLFLFLILHPNMTMIGAIRASEAGIAAEKKWTAQRVSKGLGELFRNGLINRSEEANLIVLPNFLKYNAPANPNVVQGWESIVGLLPECDLLTQYYQHCAEFVETLGKRYVERLPEPFRNGCLNGMPNQKQEQKQKQKEYNTCHEPLSEALRPEENSEKNSGISIILKSGKYWPVPLDKIAAWEAAYPDIDVTSELLKCAAWNESNPAKRKKSSGIARHVNSWLSRKSEAPAKHKTESLEEYLGLTDADDPDNWTDAEKALYAGETV